MRYLVIVVLLTLESVPIYVRSLRQSGANLELMLMPHFRHCIKIGDQSVAIVAVVILLLLLLLLLWLLYGRTSIAPLVKMLNRFFTF